MCPQHWIKTSNLFYVWSLFLEAIWTKTKTASSSSFFLMEAEEKLFLGTQSEPILSLTNYNLLISLIRIVFVLIGVAYFTLAERKIMASIQRRRGPNVVGLFGLLQPLADGLKLLCKEMVVPTKANSLVFLVAPIVIIILSLVGWLVIPFSPTPPLNPYINQIPLGLIESSRWEDPALLVEPINQIRPLLSGFFWQPDGMVQTLFNTLGSIDPSRYPKLFSQGPQQLLEQAPGQLIPSFLNVSHLEYFWIPTRNFYYPIADLNLSILFLLAISSLNVYGIIIAGWASNSKYAFLGSLRSAAQMISYEVSIGLTILPVILLAGSSNITEIVLAQERTVWFAGPLLPCALVFFVSMLAETNRAPFDLPEAEAELVAGYNVEYSSIIFAMFFLGEYSNMLLMSAISVVLFWGGWLPILTYAFFIPAPIWMAFKIVVMCFFFVLVRATFPRYRYDQLMNIGWKVFLPLTLAFFFFIAGLLYWMEAAPYFKEIDLDFWGCKKKT